MLIDIAISSPPYKVNQNKAAEELKLRMNASPTAARMIDAAAVHSGIENRCIILPDAEDADEKKFYSDDKGYISPGTGARMHQYQEWSKKLAKAAVSELIEKLKINPGEIERIVTISCTGFFAPGLDNYVMEEFGIPASAKRTNIGFMGCAASIIGFNSVFEYLSGHAGNVLMISVELCSIHLQAEVKRDNILANMIFADGCAAAYFSKSNSFAERRRLKILSTDSVLFNSSSDYMGWYIGDNGFEMILSPELPRIILDRAVPELLKIIDGKKILRKDIKHWALHPGGRAILDSLQKGLELTDDEMRASRKVLREYGNMSSASILYVLQDIMKNDTLVPGEKLCAAAFGPGLTMETAIFQVI